MNVRETEIPVSSSLRFIAGEYYTRHKTAYAWRSLFVYAQLTISSLTIGFIWFSNLPRFERLALIHTWVSLIGVPLIFVISIASWSLINPESMKYPTSLRALTKLLLWQAQTKISQLRLRHHVPCNRPLMCINPC